MINTTLCYLMRDGCVLMLRRDKKENDLNEGKCIGVGGKFEPGESAEQCVRRETFEETGLTIGRLHFYGIIHFRSDTWEDEEMYLFSSDDFSGQLKEDCPEGELFWVPKDRVMELPLWEGDRLFLRPMLDGRDAIELTLEYEGDELVFWRRGA